VELSERKLLELAFDKIQETLECIEEDKILGFYEFRERENEFRISH